MTLGVGLPLSESSLPQEGLAHWGLLWWSLPRSGGEAAPLICPVGHGQALQALVLPVNPLCMDQARACVNVKFIKWS